MRMHHIRQPAVAAIGIALMACGANSSSTSSTAATAHFPVTIAESGGASVTISKQPQLMVYHELDDTYYSATSATFIGQVYALLGLKNIADGATAAAPDYPQLSAEYIVSSSPDLIVLADTKCCHQDLNTVSARPGWSSIAAVKSAQVIGVDDDIASRWGPRVVDFLRVIAPHVKQLELQAP